MGRVNQFNQDILIRQGSHALTTVFVMHMVDQLVGHTSHTITVVQSIQQQIERRRQYPEQCAKVAPEKLTDYLI